MPLRNNSLTDDDDDDDDLQLYLLKLLCSVLSALSVICVGGRRLVTGSLHARGNRAFPVKLPP